MKKSAGMWPVTGDAFAREDSGILTWKRANFQCIVIVGQDDLDCYLSQSVWASYDVADFAAEFSVTNLHARSC